jgi:hypothetical protein
MSQFDSGRNRFTAGIGSVGSYQVSGVPWITGSITLAAGATDKHVFPSVTKQITIINTDALDADNSPVLQVHFNPVSAQSPDVITGRHFVPLWADQMSIDMNVKCREIYITNADGSLVGSYCLIAELTGIDKNEMFNLTGSGLTTINGT